MNSEVLDVVGIGGHLGVPVAALAHEAPRAAGDLDEARWVMTSAEPDRLTRAYDMLRGAAKVAVVVGEVALVAGVVAATYFGSVARSGASRISRWTHERQRVRAAERNIGRLALIAECTEKPEDCRSYLLALLEHQIGEADKAKERATLWEYKNPRRYAKRKPAWYARVDEMQQTVHCLDELATVALT